VLRAAPWLMVVVALPLAGCDKPPAPPPPAEPKENAPAERIAALPEAQRNGVFIRAIRDAGQDCQHVERSTLQGEVDGRPAWLAVCRGGGHWTIGIGKDGVAQVMSTADVMKYAPKPN
jgi:hypothetical protein